MDLRLAVALCLAVPTVALAGNVVPEPTTCPGKIAHAASDYRCSGGGNAGAACGFLGDPICSAGGGACLPAPGGRATYYTYNGNGACGYETSSPTYPMIAAMNEPEYAGASACGRCLLVTGPLGSVVVQVADLCPFAGNEQWCGDPGHLDLNEPAFAAIADLGQGVVPVVWETVPCPTGGPVAIRFHEHAHQFWVALQPREHRSGIATLEIDRGGTWVALPRETWNYFISETGGAQPGPFNFRLTDVHGHRIETGDIPFVVDVDLPGETQLPPCEDLFADGFESGDVAAWSAP